MADQLYVYNRTLQILKTTALASLAETGERLDALNTAYGELKTAFLEEGYWKFAIRSIQIGADASATPNFGFPYAFGKPTDWVKTYQVSASEFFTPHLSLYEDWIEETGCWWSNVDPMFVRYVSKDAAYGLSLAEWTGKYTEAFCHELAVRCIGIISGADPKEIQGKAEATKSMALQFEAHREPAKRATGGSWTAASRGGRWSGKKYLRG